jgi:WD40 repeat protein
VQDAFCFGLPCSHVVRYFPHTHLHAKKALTQRGLAGHDSVVHFASFAGKSNEFLLAGDQAGQVKAWSLSTRRPAASWFATPSREAVLSVHELAEGRWLSQSKSGTLSVWNADRIVSDSELNAHGAVEASVTVDMHSFCKCEVLDEQTVLVPSDGGIACGLWDIRSAHVEAKFSPSGEASQTLAAPGPRGPTGMCMALGTTGACYLLGGYEDGSVQLWDIRNTRPLHASRPHTEPVFGISGVPFPPRDSSVYSAACVSGGADGNLVINTWKRSAEKEKVSWGGDGTKFPLMCEGSKGVSAVHARHDAKIVAAGCWDGKVRLYSLKKPRILASMACHSKGVQCVRFSRDCSLLASCSEDMRIAVWQVYPPE